MQGDLEARRSALIALRQTMQKYDSGQGVAFEPDNEDSYVDIVDLAQKVKGGVNDAAVQAAADKVIAQALPSNQRFVAYESHMSKAFVYAEPIQGTQRTYNVQLDNAHGLALYYPPRSSTNPESAYVNYIQHKLFSNTRGNGWTSFLGQGLPVQLSGDPVPLLNNTLMAPFLPTTTPAQNKQYRVFLPVTIR